MIKEFCLSHLTFLVSHTNQCWLGWLSSLGVGGPVIIMMNSIQMGKLPFAIL